ncbi:phosphoethanolamine N-methyltransferase (TAM domain methyltransferase) [Colletotrichum musicola]|uniref:Phosphoethanolamine N-methyltransferase (TAM domain methyltransferase) n=1 Tax=Colletotrichum musicola TaxID=2175873 RepID=A0A8H6KNI2_9PEZI|nr:phosphoethanolamine N-methyltransferase (TAM domain methyltransferase) [Colletotrichum musicola]
MASADEPSQTAEAAGSPKSFKSAKSAGSPTRSPPRPPSEHGSPAAVEADAAAEEDGDQPRLEAESDVDSDIASNYASDVCDTVSTTSSIFNYEYENGRRYHAYRAGQYLLPNDETEQERLDMTHHVFLLTLKGEICATPLENPQRILDIGTGTGIWAIEIGDIFPSAEVIGTDLSPIQPTWVPPNVHFEIDDATLNWTFPKDHFDFIHARTLAGAIRDWPALLHQCYEHSQPGGRVEIAEGRANFFCDDDTLHKDSATWQWLSEFRKLSEPLGFDIAPALPDMIRAEGFEDVEIKQRVVPMGTWPRNRELKEIGRWFRVQFLEMALEAYTLALFTRAGNWKNEEVQVLLALVRDELKSDKIHLYTYTAFVTGRKPLNH